MCVGHYFYETDHTFPLYEILIASPEAVMGLRSPSQCRVDTSVVVSCTALTACVVVVVVSQPGTLLPSKLSHEGLEWASNAIDLKEIKQILSYYGTKLCRN